MAAKELFVKKSISLKELSNIQNKGIRAFCPAGIVFGLEGVRTFWTISSLCVLNCYNIYFRTKCLKKSDKKNYIKSSCIFFVSKYHNTPQNVYIKKNTLLNKNWFYFFFLIFWHSQVSPSFRMVLTKTRNNLKWPTTSKKRPETTYNDL